MLVWLYCFIWILLNNHYYCLSRLTVVTTNCSWITTTTIPAPRGCFLRDFCTLINMFFLSGSFYQTQVQQRSDCLKNYNNDSTVLIINAFFFNKFCLLILLIDYLFLFLLFNDFNLIYISTLCPAPPYSLSRWILLIMVILFLF